MTARPRCILCIDDQKNDRDLQSVLFELNGYKVLTAADWFDGSQLLNQNKVDIVVLDYRLVNASAIDVAIQIRKSRPRVPILLLSGFLNDVPEYFKRAVDGCMAKSSPHQDWLGMIRELSLPEAAASAGY